jgi:hypothetical protein
MELLRQIFRRPDRFITTYKSDLTKVKIKKFQRDGIPDSRNETNESHVDRPSLNIKRWTLNASNAGKPSQLEITILACARF